MENDGWAFVIKFLVGSGGVIGFIYAIYTRIRKQAMELQKQTTDISDLKKEHDEMRVLLNKMTDRFEVVSIRLGELTGILKDHYKDIEQLKVNDQKFETIVQKIFDKQDTILNVVTDMRIKIAEKWPTIAK